MNIRASDRIGNLYSPQTAMLYLNVKASTLSWLEGIPDSYVLGVSLPAASTTPLSESLFSLTSSGGGDGAASMASLPKSQWRLNSTHWSTMQAHSAPKPNSLVLASRVEEKSHDALPTIPTALSARTPDTRAVLTMSAVSRVSSLDDSYGVIDTGALTALLPPSRYSAATDSVPPSSARHVSPRQHSAGAGAGADGDPHPSGVSASEQRYWFYVTGGASLCESVTVGVTGVPLLSDRTAAPDNTVPDMRTEWMARVSQHVPPAPTSPDGVARANAILEREMDQVTRDYTQSCRKAVLDYVLKHDGERTRLGILTPPTASLGLDWGWGASKVGWA